MVGIVDDNEFDVVPSEKNAESEEVAVIGWFRVIVIGDFDEDECELLGRRRSIIRFDFNWGYDDDEKLIKFLFVLSFRID